MNRNAYIEDTSIENRKKEIEFKLIRVRDMLRQHDAEALLLAASSQF